RHPAALHGGAGIPLLAVHARDHEQHPVGVARTEPRDVAGKALAGGPAPGGIVAVFGERGATGARRGAKSLSRRVVGRSELRTGVSHHGCHGQGSLKLIRSKLSTTRDSRRPGGASLHTILDIS